MRKFAGLFDKLYFTESSFGLPVIEGVLMRVPVQGLFVLRGHPLLDEGDGPYSGWLVFDKVRDSMRTVTEYVGESKMTKNFKESYNVQDGPFPASAEDDEVSTFGFEGLQLDPRAWIDNWIVRAGSFELIIE